MVAFGETKSKVIERDAFARTDRTNNRFNRDTLIEGVVLRRATLQLKLAQAATLCLKFSQTVSNYPLHKKKEK